MAIRVLGKGIFGVDGDFGTYTQSMSQSKSSQEATAMDNEGNFVGVALYGQQEELSLDVLVTCNSKICIGQQWCSTNYVVTNYTLTTNATDFQRYSVTIKQWGELGWAQRQNATTTNP